MKNKKQEEQKLDAQSLFAERDNTCTAPDEVLSFLRDVVLKNDSLPVSSQRRVSIERASEYLKKNGYNLGPTAIRTIIRTHLNRKGWGRA